MFVLKDYVEKLSKMDPSTGLVPQSVSERKPFDPVSLLNTFKESIETLKELSNRNQRRVEKLEQVCSQQEREHEARIRELDRLYTVRNPIENLCTSVFITVKFKLSPSRKLLGTSRSWKTGLHMLQLRWSTLVTNWRALTIAGHVILRQKH